MNDEQILLTLGSFDNVLINWLAIRSKVATLLVPPLRKHSLKLPFTLHLVTTGGDTVNMAVLGTLVAVVQTWFTILPIDRFLFPCLL